MTLYDVGIMLGPQRALWRWWWVACGNGLGAVVGGLLVGVLEAMGAGYISSAYWRCDAVCADPAGAVLHAARPVWRQIDRSGVSMQKSSYIGLGLLVAVLLVLPWVVPNSYYMDLAIRIGINAIIVIGLNLLIGFAGQISLGHAGFLGIGAYASAVLPTHFAWHPLLAMGAGAVATAVIAGLVARPFSSSRATTWRWPPWGWASSSISPCAMKPNGRAAPMAWPCQRCPCLALNSAATSTGTAVVATLLAFSVWASLNMIDSPFGRALRALHGSEVASQVVGVNVVRYKVTIFVMSAVFASIMGSITAHYMGLCHALTLPISSIR